MSDSPHSTSSAPNRRLKISLCVYYGLLGSLIVIPTIFGGIATLLTLPILPLAPFIVLSGDTTFSGIAVFFSKVGIFYDTVIIPATFITAFISGCWMTIESMVAFKSTTSQRTRILYILSTTVFILPWLFAGLLLLSKMQIEK